MRFLKFGCMALLLSHITTFALTKQEEASTRRTKKAIHRLYKRIYASDGYCYWNGETTKQIDAYVYDKIKLGAIANLALDIGWDLALGTNGVTSIGLAASQNQHYDLISSLLRQNQLNADAPEDSAVGMLHILSANSAQGPVKNIISFGARINRKLGTLTGSHIHYPSFKKGRTALMIATASKQYEVMDVLLAALADADIEDDEKDTAFSLAWVANDKIAIKKLLEAKATPRLPPSWVEQYKKVPGSGCTPLMVSVRQHDIELMNILLKAGVRVAETCGDGTTALSLAASAGFMDAVRILIEHGAIVSAAADANAIFMHVSGEGLFATIRLLLREGGVDLKLLPDGGLAAKQAAIARGHSLDAAVLETGGRFVEREASRDQGAALETMKKAVEAGDYMAAMSAREHLLDMSSVRVSVEQSNCYAANFFFSYTNIADFKVYGRLPSQIRETLCTLTDAEQAELVRVRAAIAARGEVPATHAKSETETVAPLPSDLAFMDLPDGFFLPSKN
jgi:ankyrin repeat protein